jgi:hypothetical protein
MTYDPTVPQVGNTPSVSVDDIRANFTAYDASFSQTSGGVIYNHLALNEIDEGLHAAVLFERQTTDPTIDNDFVSLYSKNATSGAGTLAQLFFRIPQFLPNSGDNTKAPNNPMQWTYNSVNIAGPQYQSFMIGGYLVFFGSSVRNVDINLSPVPTKILSVIAESQSTITVSGVSTVPVAASVEVLTASKFQIHSVNDPGGTNFLWMAIAQA